MDNETKPNENDNDNENECEVVESNDAVNENGCDANAEVDGSREVDDTVEKPSPDQSDESATKAEDSPKQMSPLNEARSEPDQFDAIDAKSPLDNTPEKDQDGACMVSSPSEIDETANDKSWNEINDSSPEKSRSETAFILSSPSEMECDEAVNGNWARINTISKEDMFEDSMDDESDEDEDIDTYIDTSKSDYNRGRDTKGEVFELTDGNSSMDDPRSDIDEEIDGEEMLGEDEDSDYSEVHNIDDSDDEPFIESTATQNMHRMPYSAKTASHHPVKPYDRQSNFVKRSELMQQSSRVRSHLQILMQKQSASRLHRYLAVKKSIKWLNKAAMRDNRGVNRMVEVLNSSIDSGSTSNLMSKSTPVDVSVLKERNTNDNSDQAKARNDGRDPKGDDNGECNSNAQSASELSVKRSVSHQSENNLMINLELEDDIDYDDKCAKALTSEGDNDSHALGMDVDEPDDNLYVGDGSESGAKVADDNDDPVTIESEEEDDEDVDKSRKSQTTQQKAIVMNGINKNRSSDNLDKEAKSGDENLVKANKKRKISISSDEEEQAPPAKNPRNDLEAHFNKHDKLIRRMMDTSTSTNKNDPANLQRDIEQLNGEIEALDEAARTKEIEWNNILYLKKMKEDILLRLNRRKTVMEIMATKSIDNPESLFLNSNLDCLNEIAASESKRSTGAMGPATSFIMSRCNMKSGDLAKEKSNLNELHRNIQPKSTRADAAATFANVVTSIPKSSPAMQYQQAFLQQRLRENGQNHLDQSANKMQIGRQGQIKDVQSIIASFRQTHPEVVPRRGRRLKNVNQNAYGSEHASGDNDALVADLLSKRNNDISSPPTSNDSTYSNSQLLLSKAGSANQYASISAGNFKQAFNESNIGGLGLKNNSLLTSTPLFKNQNSGIGYPEVTLHPIGQSSHAALLQNQKNNNDHLPDAHNSLLHGILTKSPKFKGSSTVTAGMASNNNNAAGFNNAFSPTLARLLTAPERNFALSPALGSNNTAGMNLSKSSNSRMQQDTKPEISCLPISQILALQQQQQQNPNNSLLQQQLQRYQRDFNKLLPKNNGPFGLDDEADDSDRLVIDEEQYSNSELIGGPSGKNDDAHDNELPECQGCKKREAQFVCADCQRQWYCSRECQVMAWDEHSEVCAR